jgi:hypothetical protein
VSGPISFYHLYNETSGTNVYLFGDEHYSSEGMSSLYLGIDILIKKLLNNSNDFELFTECYDFQNSIVHTNNNYPMVNVNYIINTINKKQVNLCLPRQKEFIVSHKLKDIYYFEWLYIEILYTYEFETICRLF